MRILPAASFLPLCLLLAMPLSLSCMAAPTGEPAFDESVIAQLEQRAQQANPREQCFLYTELIQQMTVVAGRQLLDGDSERASDTLKRIERYTHLIHANLARDTKRIKQAQIAMNGATRRLGEYLHRLSPEDKVVVQSTLAQLNQVNDEMLTQVFAH